MEKPSIIVIGRSDVIKLGLIRSIGRLGYRVIVIHLVNSYSIRNKPIDYYSKYVYSYYFSKKEDLVRLLIEKCSEKDQKPILFTLDDLSIYLIDQSHHLLRDLFLYAHVNNQEGGIIKLMDKSVQKTEAFKAGLNVANGWIISIVNGEYNIPNDIKYPCFVKGALCYEGGKQLQQVCQDEKELYALLQDNKQCSSSLLVEEYLSVDEELGFMGISDGEHSYVPVMVEKTEIGKGTSNGVTMAGNIQFLMDSSPVLLSINKFLLNIGYTGISNFDFIKSGGKLYFLEVNFRYAAYGYGASLAGLNFPQLFIKSILGDGVHDLNIEKKTNIRIFNEKIALRNVIQHLMKFSKYRILKKQADYCMVYSKDDQRPYFLFIVRYFCIYVKSRIRSFFCLLRK